MNSMFEIKKLGKEDGEWFDLGSRTNVSGKHYSFEIKDDISGTWNLNVRIQSDGSKADASPATSQKVGSLYDQIKRKSITFNPTKDGKKFYNVLGLGYVEDGRFHSGRTSNMDDVPVEIKENFDIKKYQDVSPNQNSVQFKDKLVVVLDKEDSLSMTKLFFFQKIKPVF